MTSCLLEAALQEIERLCDCFPSFHVLGFNLSTTEACRGTGIRCMEQILNRMGRIDTIVDRGVTKKCMAPCEDQTNPYQLSFLNYPNRNTFRMK